jgi:hypothetical protein
MSKGKTKEQNITSNISAESILITWESNWIQRLLRVKRERDKQDVRDIRASLDSGADGPGPRSVRIRSQ